ncbi:hypothetical protein M426DRAFT_316520 [Hypoxylon sp. CI-4A]|nr:hypothetical protein M426DRAFT_316520 [Hypoxylon sp. CI-4A]
MYTSTILASLLSLTSLALARPVETRDEAQFTITSLGATFPYPGVYGVDAVDSYVNVGLSYPDASANGSILSTTCEVAWPKGTTPGPTEWTPCANTAVQFRLPADGWIGNTNFKAEFWAGLSDASGLYASHILTAGPGNGNDPNAYMFCIQKGKFNPLTCTLTGPYGSTARTVEMTATEEALRPN